jgi:hypothetical protein
MQMSSANEIIEKYKTKLAALTDERILIINKFIKKLEDKKIEKIRKDLSQDK